MGTDMTPADVHRMNTLIADLRPKDRLRVLDIGANPLIEGDVSYKPLLDHGHAEVFGFEPQEDALAALNDRKSANETYLPHALGDGKEKTLHLYQQGGFTSIFPANEDSARYLGFEKGMTEKDAIKIKTRKLDSLKEVPTVDFLKIDVQGSEKAILKHGKQRLSNAIALQTEVRMFPLYRGEPRYGELEAEIVAQGFEFLRFASMKHVSLARRHRGRIRRHDFAQAVDGDAFFVRDLRNVDSYTDEHLKKLAIIGDAIMGLFDVALYALDILVERSVITEDVINRYFSNISKQRLR
jgi:FkbM family methyltransferase